MCDDGKETDILEKIFGKDKVSDEQEKDLTKKNELIEIFKGGLKSLPGKKRKHHFELKTVYFCMNACASRQILFANDVIPFIHSIQTAA